MSRNAHGRGALTALLAALGGGGSVSAAINFDPASTLTLTHDLDLSQAGPVKVVNVGPGTALGTIPRSRDLYPLNPYQINSVLPNVGAANSSLGVGSLGQVTNNTTASFTLATGSGVTQADPAHVIPGASSLLYNVDLRWTVPASGQFGPLANGFATIAAGGTVGAGGSAQLVINLNFRNAAGTALRNPWTVNKTWLGGASGTSIAETFTTARVLGNGTLAAGTSLRIQGTIEFRASNDGEPTELAPVRAEIGGTPPTGVFMPNPIGGRNWDDPAVWMQPTDPSETNILTAPNGPGHRALFFGTTGGSAAAIRSDTPITLGTLDVDNTGDFGFVGGFVFQTLAGAGNAVLNFRGVRGQSFLFSPITLNNSLDMITEGTSVGINGVISGAGGLSKLGPGTLILNSDNTYSGGTTVREGLLQVSTPVGGSGTGSGGVAVQDGGTLGGRGVIGGVVNVASGGIVDPGDNSVQPLTVGGLTFNSGARLNLQGSGASFDRIEVTGTNTLVLGGPTSINLHENSAVTPGDHVILNYNGAALSSISNLSLTSPALGRNLASLVNDSANRNVLLRLVQGPQWNADANGNWGTGANWSPSSVPTIVANLLGTITAARTISLNGSRTVHNLNFDNLNAYTISQGIAGSVLNIADSTHQGNIHVDRGSHTIAAPLALPGGGTIDVEASAALTSSGGLSIAAGKTLLKDGDGTLTLSGTQNNGAGAALKVARGTVNLNANGGSNLTVQVLASTASAEIVLGADQDVNELDVDFAPLRTQTLDLKSGTAAGAFRRVRVYAADLEAAREALWSAIVNANKAGTTDALDGIVDSNLHANSAIGIRKMADHVLIRPTRVGDLNLDGMVTIADFIDLAAHFNQVGRWEDGDVNYDGGVTIADYIDLASNFNASYAGEIWPISEADARVLAGFAQAQGVPEPGTALVALGALGWLGRRERRSSRLQV